MNSTRFVALAILTFMAAAAAFSQTTGAIYVNSNQTTNNEVWSYARASDGTLVFAGKFATQGSGSGGVDLKSQGSIAVSQDGKFVFAVNADSNDVTSFSVQTGAQLNFVSKVSSGGTFPNSLTVFGSLLYVLNQGSSRINAFRVSSSGQLFPISNSSRKLSGPGALGGQVSFSPDGTLLLVAEHMSNKLDTFTVGSDGRATGPLVQPSAGIAPLGFAFDNAGHVVVSEVRFSTISSYAVSSAGVMTLITSSLKDFGVAACWTANTNNPNFPAQYSYITNTRADTVSGLRIGSDGSVTLLNADGITATLPSGAFPLDDVVSADSNYLYVLAEHLPGLIGFKIQSDGSLVQVTTVTGIPTSSFGLAGN
jgi:6-phosphogluconolactonase (cycloisomerase 2 family)